jgi:nuclear RNA export factor
LDGEELPAAIGFDVIEASNLPQNQPGYLPEDIQKFIHGFFEAYYNIYDSEDRQGLIQAYHDQALFSLSISRHDNSSHRFPEELIQESRNLLRVKDFSLRNKLVKNGKVNIVSALCEMPKSKHEPNSFLIDVPFCNNSFILVVVNGVYRELLKKHQPLRAFCRTFYIVPQGQGFVIVNDLLLLTNASVPQIQKYTQSNKSINDNTMADVEFNTKSILRVSTGDSSASSSTNKYESIISKFMNATRMNRSFSVRCLEENQYNMESAYTVYQKLRDQNMIPPEAFDQ